MKRYYVSRELHISYPVGSSPELAVKFIEKVVPIVKDIIKEDDVNIWVRGSSGTILGTLLMAGLCETNNVTITHIKKVGEDSHCGGGISDYRCEGRINILIDDLISSGETIEAIWEKAKKYISNMEIVILNNPRVYAFPSFSPLHLITRADED